MSWTIIEHDNGDMEVITSSVHYIIHDNGTEEGKIEYIGGKHEQILSIWNIL